MKKFIGALLLITAAVLITMQIFKSEYKRTLRNIGYEYYLITDPDMNRIEDGIYPGNFLGFPLRVELQVTVKSHKIEKIEILNQMSGKGYEAKEMPERIVKAQKIQTDAVTGATISSKIIMIAVHRALQKR